MENDGTHYLFALATFVVPCVDPNSFLVRRRRKGAVVGDAPAWKVVVLVNLGVTYWLGRAVTFLTYTHGQQERPGCGVHKGIF